jgi:hypothetical protein
MEIARFVSDLAAQVKDLPGESRILDASLHEAIGKLKLGASLQDMLRSKMTVRQILVTLANLVHAAHVDQQGSQFSAIDGMAHSFADPVATGHHLISTAMVDENPDYKRVATALLQQKNLDYDQSIETYESQTRRFKMMQALGDCHHKRLFVLGDDAMFSLYLAMHGVTSEIWVGDIDADLLAFIQSAAKKHGISNINVFEYNVYDALPPEHQGAFDCVTINGFKDLGGLLMFICRGVQSLKEPKSRRTGYFNFGSVDVTEDAMYGIDFELQKFLTKIGVTLEHVSPAPESHIDNDITQAMADIVDTAARANDAKGCVETVDKGLADVKQRFGRISWVAVDNFPDIVLSPLKIGKFRVHDLQENEIKRFLRLTGLFAK